MYFSHISEIINYVSKLELQSGEQLMIFVGDRSAASLSELTTYLNEHGLTFFGGIFPGLLYSGKYIREGFLLQVVRPVFQTIVYPFVFRVPPEIRETKDLSAIMLIDGLSSQFRDIVDTVERKLGNDISYIGGGAGYYDLQQRPCVFNNKGVYQDAMMLCLVAGKATIAVKHGWNILDGPYTITKSSQNVLSELDGYKAMEIYRDILEEHENVIVSHEDFFSFSKDHPFGLMQPDGSLVVRDPLTFNDAMEITCVADLPTKSTLYVLKGDKRSLLKSSLEIAKECAEKAPEHYTPLLFNCISRAMFLENEFAIEIENVQSRLSKPIIGTLSIGEISTGTDGKLLIHNKSTILGLSPI